jgi:OFA family oxalate/formate antiporter-like MFS transporter
MEALSLITPAQDKQKQIISNTHRIIIVIASILIMICCGAVYAWSIFVAPLKSDFGYTTTDTQIVFGLIIGVFTIGMLFVNKVLRKYGPRITGIIGAVLFTSGYMVASLSNGNLFILILGMSVISGVGMAFGYVTVLNNLVKWFPNNKGLATGLAVSGFGAGAILLSQIARPLLNSGWPVLDIFRTVGIVYGIIFTLGSLFLSVPSWYQTKPEEEKVDVRRMLRDKRFWTLFYVFFAGTFAGLLFTGNLKPIGQLYGVSEGATVLAVSMFAFGNAVGRIVWGQIHDMLGGEKTVISALFLIIVIMLLLLTGSANNITFIALSLMLGFTFGGNMVFYAADSCNIWGVAKLDIIYPAISIAYGISGIVGPVVGGLIKDITGSYSPAIIIGTVVCSSGIVVYYSLKPHEKPQPSRIKTRAEAETSE